jgi:hypothetical protein
VSKEWSDVNKAPTASLTVPGSALNSGGRQSLRERIEKRTALAIGEGVKARQLGELCLLLDKHPDVARILELIDLVGDR